MTFFNPFLNALTCCALREKTFLPEGRGGSRPSARGLGEAKYNEGGAPLGSSGKAPVRGSEGGPSEADNIFLFETNFLTKLSHKFRKFRLHGERGRASEPACNGFVGY